MVRDNQLTNNRSGGSIGPISRELVANTKNGSTSYQRCSRLCIVTIPRRVQVHDRRQLICRRACGAPGAVSQRHRPAANRGVLITLRSRLRCCFAVASAAPSVESRAGRKPASRIDYAKPQNGHFAPRATKMRLVIVILMAKEALGSRKTSVRHDCQRRCINAPWSTRR